MTKTLKITQEISTWKYLAETLTQEHQQNVKDEILLHIRNLEEQLKEFKEE